MKPFSYYAIIDACAQPGCPVCRVLQVETDRFLYALLFEFVTEPEAHHTIRASRGLCRVHSWQLRRQRMSSVSIAVLYEAVIDEALNIIGSSDQPAARPATRSRMQRLLGGSPTGSALADQLQPQTGCMCCEAMATSEDGYLRTLAESVTEPRVLEAYRDSDGLCLPHLRQTLAVTRDDQALHTILSTQRAIWSRLKEELALFRARVDAEGGHGQMGAEGSSWLRAVEAVAGGDIVGGPPTKSSYEHANDDQTPE